MIIDNRESKYGQTKGAIKKYDYDQERTQGEIQSGRIAKPL